VAAILLQAKRSKDRTGQGNGTSCDGFFFSLRNRKAWNTGWASPFNKLGL
jgi:hypothetical protein